MLPGRRRFRLLRLAGLALAGVVTAVGAVDPEPPQRFVDTRLEAPAGKTIAVPAGGDFQAALDAARPGDVITLKAGATYSGPFTLPDKSGRGWIVIRSDAPESSLPSAGSRVDPSHAGVMPKLVSANDPVIATAPGAHHYRFIGIEFRPARADEKSALQSLRAVWRTVRAGSDVHDRGTFLYSLVSLGSDANSEAALPHHIIIDRCYLHGDPDAGTRRGVVMNARSVAVIDSYLADFKEVGADSQAIVAWNGPGPFKIVNNYLEAAGENVMFGGADPSVPNLVPADIEVRRNHFSKPREWRKGDPRYAGTPWAVKNLFELKSARRVVVDGNLFEHNWPHAQNGFAVLFTVRNEDGAVPWAVVEDVAFTNNVLRRVGSGINVLGRDSNAYPSEQTRRILIQNNLFIDVGGIWGGGRLFQLLDGTSGVAIRNNTALQSDSIVLGGDGEPHEGFVFSNNIVAHNAYGIIGSGAGVGLQSIERYFPGARIRNNVLVGGAPERYPPKNFFPSTFDEVGFVDRAGGNFRLGASSPYAPRGDADDNAPGADFDALCGALAESERRALNFCASAGRGPAEAGAGG